MVTIEILGLPALVQRLDSAGTVYEGLQPQAMSESLALLEREVRDRTPRRGGRLAAGWQSQVTRLTRAGATGRVYNPVPYAWDVELDTRSHEIVAHGRALAVPPPDGYVKRVRHPGTRGQYMARDGAAAARPLIVERWRMLARALVRAMCGRGA